MLKKLQISNYAIIDEIAIEFSKNLNVITGETGAGKSILMGALSLILGDRADTSVLLDRNKKCIIEGSFLMDNNDEIKNFIKENDLDAEDEIMIRREIGANGKSRAFVNDTPVNLEQLRLLSSLMVDLHRQFDTLELGESNFQREVIDAFAAHNNLVNEYGETFRKLISVKKELQFLVDKKSQFSKEYDYNKFLFDELEKENYKENELEELDIELQLLSNSENIKSILTKANHELKESEQPLVQQLKLLSNQLQTISSFHPKLAAVLERLRSAQIELQDIAGDIEQINNEINYDAAKIEQINERISTGYKLLKKHGVKTTNELIVIQNNLSEKLQSVLDIDESITAKESEVKKLSDSANKMATTISKNRNAQVKPLEEKVNALLVQVGMPNARLKVQIQNVALNNFGMDAVEFLFDANKSNKFEPLRKVASGGELSRLMLSIKSLVAESVDLPTMIFDEIDTGISGEAAKQVGIILKKLSKKRQVICITHQPQIAGKADAHYFVYKEIKDSAIKTSIKLLTHDERIITIAKMLSGEKPTAAALENAKEMVN
ncbi:MAG TPA: DNA repair protein RecN [Puia sp.]|nr:DNA repair protein RecN [Puia sp.]